MFRILLVQIFLICGLFTTGQNIKDSTDAYDINKNSLDSLLSIEYPADSIQFHNKKLDSLVQYFNPLKLMKIPNLPPIPGFKGLPFLSETQDTSLPNIFMFPDSFLQDDFINFRYFEDMIFRDLNNMHRYFRKIDEYQQGREENWW